jgi:hypothetical protein
MSLMDDYGITEKKLIEHIVSVLGSETYTALKQSKRSLPVIHELALLKALVYDDFSTADDRLILKYAYIHLQEFGQYDFAGDNRPDLLD